MIQQLRRKLSDHPRNAIRWIDLALEHTVLGNPKQAARAMSIAMNLAPEDRFVLRAASRFYVHRGELDRAHGLLIRADSTRVDPWLVAAEIATASAADVKAKHIKVGRAMIENRKFHPRQVSELASALGTLEHETGGRRKSRRLFSKALEDPTENSVAQAEWAFNNEGVWIADVDTRRVKRLFEAQACAKLVSGEWAESLDQSLKWLSDQPFSSRPAQLASYIASSILENYDKAVEILDKARKPNPRDPGLLNNLAFAYASQGRIDLAEAALSEIGDANLDERERIVVTATKGMIAFRRGKSDEGRTLYHEAIRESSAPELVRFRVTAAINLALEELRAHSDLSIRAYRFAAEAFKGMTDVDILLMIERMKTAFLSVVGSSA